MGLIADNPESGGDYEGGGIFSISNLSGRTAAQKTTGQIIMEGLEKILQMPQLQPIIEQSSKVIGAYADKMTLDNQERLMKLQQRNNQGGGTPAAPAEAADNDMLYGRE